MRARLAGVTAAVVALTAPAAAAGEPSTARFTASYDATLTTKWKLPRHERPGNCFHTLWAQGQGEETWRVRTRGPQKVQAMRTGPRLVTWMGGWKLGGGADDIDGAGLISRDWYLGRGWTPGPCHGTAGVAPPVATDCGDRVQAYDLHLSQLGRSLGVNPLPDGSVRNRNTGYNSCRLPMAEGLSDGSWPAQVTARLEPGTVFGHRRTLTLRGTRTWTQARHPDGGYGNLSTTTTVSWTLKLKRKR